jgi:CRP-like cAMP-binding protein
MPATDQRLAYPVEFRRGILAKHFLFRELSVSVLDQLAQFTSVQSLAPHETLFQKGDRGAGLYGILRGRISIRTESAEGRAVILNVLEQGEIFGEIALIDDGVRSADANAMEATDLLHIHRDHFLPFLRRHPDLCIQMMRLLCALIRRSSGLVEDAAFLDLPARLAKRLLGLAKTHGNASDRATHVRLKITQRELADMIGATREAVNKHLTNWQAAGLIDLQRGQILICNARALEKLIEL